MSVSPRLTLCPPSAGCRSSGKKRRVIKHGSRQRLARESWLNNAATAPPMGRTGIMKPSAVSAWHRTMIPTPERKLRRESGVEAQAEFAAPRAVFATSCLLASCLNCCLAWRQRSPGAPLMPPLITSAGRGT